MSTQRAQGVLLFLVWLNNSNRFQILQSYTLFLQPPIGTLDLVIPTKEVRTLLEEHNA